MIIIPTRRPILISRRVSASFVGVAANTTNTGTVTVAKPAGTQANDYMFIFAPYGGTISGTESTSWSHDTGTWIYGYDWHVYRKILSPTDISGSVSLTTVQYAPTISVVYRGPISSFKMANAESGASDSTLNLPRTAKSSLSMGQVQWVSDRSGTGTATPPSGFTSRTGPNATGAFTGSVADLINGTQPSGSGTDTWTTFDGTSTQIGVNYELRSDDISSFPTSWTSSGEAVGGGFFVSASNVASGAATNAFDASGATTFWGANTDVAWLKVQLPLKRMCTNYHITNRSGTGNQYPTQWQFEGSEDDATWVVLDSQISQTFSLSEEKSYAVSAPRAYKYYRLNILDNSNDATIVVVANLRFTFA